MVCCACVGGAQSGHSRTIIGCVVNTRTSSIQLLVLDPDYKGGGSQLLSDLGSVADDADDEQSEGAAATAPGTASATAWRRITRSVHQLAATAYEICTRPAHSFASILHTDSSRSIRVLCSDSSRLWANVGGGNGALESGRRVFHPAPDQARLSLFQITCFAAHAPSSLSVLLLIASIKPHLLLLPAALVNYFLIEVLLPLHWKRTLALL